MRPATVDLGTFGGKSSTAYAINDLGQVVGCADKADGNSHAFRTAANQPINPATDDLGTLGGTYSCAYAINNLGQVVGESDTNTYQQGHAFRTAANAAMNALSDDLGTLGTYDVFGIPYASCEATGINDDGVVVGWCIMGDQISQSSHAFRVEPNGRISSGSELGNLGGIGTEALAINKFGQIAGKSHTPDGVMHAVATAANATSIDPNADLGTMGTPAIYATAINSSGVVVGYYGSRWGDPNSRAFIYKDGKLLDLSDLIDNPPPPWTGVRLSVATGINDAGQIVGYGTFGGFVLIPGVNQPPTVTAYAEPIVMAGSLVSLSGAVSDDNFPGTTLKTTWDQVSGPDGACICEPSAVNTMAWFFEPGTYTLRLAVSDGEFFSHADVTIQVVPNAPPTVTVEANATVIMPQALTLSGTVSDDGLPGGPISTQWGCISGPDCGLAFEDSNRLNTSAYFFGPGTYTLRLWASDGMDWDYADITVQVLPNTPPTVAIQADSTIILPNRLTLSATVSDDGSPGGPISTQWMCLNGPCGFEDSNSLNTIAYFYWPGTYTLRLSAFDGVDCGYCDVTVQVLPNAPPKVEVQSEATVTLPNVLSLSATVSDDGSPGGPISTQWMCISDPGSVAFEDSNSLNTSAYFYRPGTYTLRLSAFDGVDCGYADVTVQVKDAASPSVHIAVDPTVTVPGPLSLVGSLSDDASPPGSILMTWSMVTGPGAVTFADGGAAATTATFSRVGTYVLRLAASDSDQTAASDVTLTVNQDLRGDFSGDGQVDGSDFLIWQRNYNHGTAASGAPIVDANFNDPNYAKKNGDANGDGKTDGSDYLIWQQDYVYEH